MNSISLKILHLIHTKKKAGFRMLFSWMERYYFDEITGSEGDYFVEDLHKLVDNKYLMIEDDFGPDGTNWKAYNITDLGIEILKKNSMI